MIRLQEDPYTIDYDEDTQELWIDDHLIVDSESMYYDTDKKVHFIFEEDD